MAIISFGGETIYSETVIYEDENGSRDLTLTEDASLFEKLELQFYVKGTDGVKQFNNVAVDNPNGKTVILQGSWPSGKYYVWVGMLALAEIKEKNIKIVEDDSIQITNIIAQPFVKGTSFYITKVIGYI